MAVLDAAFLIDIDKADPGATEMLGQLTREGRPLIVPAIVALQYVGGMQDTELGWARLRDNFTVVGFGDDQAYEATALLVQLMRAGRFPGWADFLIAATAVAFGEPLVTADEKNFGNIPGVRMLTYR